MASETPEQNFSASQISEGEDSLTPLEQEVLDEYARLLGNLNTVRSPPNVPYKHYLVCIREK
jgi:DASH complex subunit DAD3